MQFSLIQGLIQLCKFTSDAVLSDPPVFEFPLISNTRSESGSAQCSRFDVLRLSWRVSEICPNGTGHQGEENLYSMGRRGQQHDQSLPRIGLSARVVRSYWMLTSHAPPHWQRASGLVIPSKWEWVLNHAGCAFRLVLALLFRSPPESSRSGRGHARCDG
ncbi:hypothetical protein P691DRAFT_802887 [Macrolepiota fuliginosa MF-IS2]|uniref:Uncharacterized protein n=1 Tax=Macrolepiota fuliginosa MF-IS2 TaxID=1400762 RepID=A0A9P6C0C9_9AGAR|nr:hypothetical protein P691DRAFT_802887 [Macrolepiota fuliginosa MF-IS2]